MRQQWCFSVLRHPSFWFNTFDTEIQVMNLLWLIPTDLNRHDTVDGKWLKWKRNVGGLGTFWVVVEGLIQYSERGHEWVQVECKSTTLNHYFFTEFWTKNRHARCYVQRSTYLTTDPEKGQTGFGNFEKLPNFLMFLIRGILNSSISANISVKILKNWCMSWQVIGVHVRSKFLYRSIG